MLIWFVAALLHDTIEKSEDSDRHIVEEQIKKDCGEYIYNIVSDSNKAKNKEWGKRKSIR